MTTFYRASKKYSAGLPGYCDMETAVSDWHTTRLACKSDCFCEQADDWEARCAPSLGEDKAYTWETKEE